MTDRSNIGLFLLAASSFVGGLAAGLLLAPKSGKESRRWINTHATELTNWVDEKGRDAIHKSEDQFRRLRRNVQENIKEHVPDLYEATEHIQLDESDLMHG